MKRLESDPPGARPSSDEPMPDAVPDYREMFESQARILARYGHPVSPPARVLDFGCGVGGLVEVYRSAGFDAYGCDVELETENDRLRLIPPDPYRLPFPDDFFDLVVSNQVFEHVQNPRTAFAEIRRVLTTDGVSLHTFPGRYRVREGHTFVPFGSVVRTPWWLRFWAWVGIRNTYQRGLPARTVADQNHDFLTTHTLYLTRRQIRRLVPDVFFAEAFQVEHALERRHLPRILRLLSPLYSAFKTRIIITHG
jgi:SAM-dependent methyltransferase